MQDPGELAEALRLVVAAATNDTDARVDGLRRLSGGASRETWALQVVHADGRTRDLILRRDPPGAGRLGATGGMAMEAHLLGAAADQGVPVPRVLAASDDPSVLGSAFVVMDHIHGETIPRRILRDDAFVAARPKLAAQCGRVLAAIHRVPVAGVPGLPPAADPLDQWRDTLDLLAQPHPAFELGLRWLAANRPTPRPPTLVHGDFRNGNLIVGPDGLRAVLDWELAHAGDPLEDLGWLCVRAWRFGVDRRVGGFGDVEDLVAAYEAESATTIDLDALRWWETLGTLRWGVMCIMQASVHLTGAVRSVELAAIGRRVCENEWDLLNLLPSPFGGRT